jgi:hypothetical protein
VKPLTAVVVVMCGLLILAGLLGYLSFLLVLAGHPVVGMFFGVGGLLSLLFMSDVKVHHK